VVLHVLRVVVLDDQAAVMTDPLAAVVLDAEILVFFRMNKDLLLALLVLEADLIETDSAKGRIGLHITLGLLGGQRVGDPLLGIVNPASHYRLGRERPQETHQGCRDSS